MNANIIDSDESEPGKDDDFFALSHLFSVSELNYVDIARKGNSAADVTLAVARRAGKI